MKQARGRATVTSGPTNGPLTLHGLASRRQMRVGPPEAKHWRTVIGGGRFRVHAKMA